MSEFSGGSEGRKGRERRPPRRTTALLAALGLFLVPASNGEGPEPVTEYQLKAAFLLNVARFVEWPEPVRDGPIQFCVAGKDPFGDLLPDVLRDQRVQGRPLAAVHPRSPAEMRQCRVLFVSASERKRAGDILKAVRGAPVLTVGETPRFAEDGGMVNMVLDASKIRLESNPDAVAQAGLRISSRLLQLTRVVRAAAGGSQ